MVLRATGWLAMICFKGAPRSVHGGANCEPHIVSQCREIVPEQPFAALQIDCQGLSSLASSRFSHARTMVHSPSTVRLETPNSVAISSIFIPPKKRNCTI